MRTRVRRTNDKKAVKRCSVRLQRIEKLIDKHKRMPVRKQGSVNRTVTDSRSHITLRSSPAISALSQSRGGVKAVRDTMRSRQAISEEFGRSKRTPKPNRKYIENSVKYSEMSATESDATSELSDTDNEENDFEKTVHGNTGRKRGPGPKSKTQQSPKFDQSKSKGTDAEKRLQQRPGPLSAVLRNKRKLPDDEKLEMPRNSSRKRVRKDSEETFEPDASDNSESENESEPMERTRLATIKTRSVNSPLLDKGSMSFSSKSNETRSSSATVKPSQTPASLSQAIRRPPSAILRPRIDPTSTTASSDKAQTNPSKPIDIGDLEDFEQMPTFTIVNINDIINQKEEIVVIEKGSKDGDDTIDSNDDIDSKLAKLHGSSNRRKAQHTIKSDRILKTPKGTSPILTLSNPLLNDSTKPYRNIIGGKNGKFRDQFLPDKVPPRILNSALCKNANAQPITPVVSKTQPGYNNPRPLVPKRFMSSSQIATRNNNNNNNLGTSPSKENIKTNANTSRELQSGKQRTFTETVLGNRRIRKITCFETWFVIKFPPCDAIAQKCWISFSLMKLGNEISDVMLPTERWSYKISLQRIYKDVDDDAEIYTGEVHDPLISPNDRHLYQPVNIMFRRQCEDNNLRMQFDRAVIFKNQSFFVHIDGKHVKLLGAPQYLEDFNDIEVLLQIVDDITLINPCVEQSALIK